MSITEPDATPLDTPAVVLVDEHDNELGQLDKLAAHQPPGRLHRAFSVFVHDDAGRMLLQRRATTKYHFGGLWTNTCCSHPWPGETVLDAAVRRTRDELGVELLAPHAVAAFTYRAVDPVSGLVEHEHDTVVTATVDAEPTPNPAEVDECRWVTRPELDRWLVAEPTAFTPWFPLALAALDGAAGHTVTAAN